MLPSIDHAGDGDNRERRDRTTVAKKGGQATEHGSVGEINLPMVLKYE